MNRSDDYPDRLDSAPRRRDEVPAARWHGPRRLEPQLRRLLAARLALAALCAAFAPQALAEPDAPSRDAAAAPMAPGRPNVILIITDDQGYGDIGAHGNTVIQNAQPRPPHGRERATDRLPRRSDLLADALGADDRPLFDAHRRLAHDHGPLAHGRRDERTWRSCSPRAGYATGQFGKWHLGDNYPCRPQDQGFAEAFYHRGGGVGQSPDYLGQRPTSTTPTCAAAGSEARDRLLHRRLVRRGAASSSRATATGRSSATSRPTRRTARTSSPTSTSSRTGGGRAPDRWHRSTG